MARSLRAVCRWIGGAAVGIFALGCRPHAIPNERLSTDEALLDAARGVATWLRSTHSADAGGVIWPADALRPSLQSLDLSTGVAGQVLFFSELYAATRDSADLRTAREGADLLMQELRRRDSVPMRGEATLYRGLPGIGVALRAVYRATGNPRYADAHRSVAHDLARRARAVARASWSDSNDVMFGDAGTGLFVLEAGRVLRDTTLLNTAAAVAHTLVRRGIPEHGGLTWRRSENSQFVLPNFSHGAAGIGLFLAMAGHATNDRALDSAAHLAARYLMVVGQRDSLGFRVPYGWPEPAGGWSRPFDVGWAHGPAGTARLYWQLWRATDDSTYLAIVEDCVQAVRHAGLFGTPVSEYGSAPFALTMRFDLAGVADFLADLYRVTENHSHLRLAREIADTIVARAHVPARDQLRWVTRRYGFMSDAGQPGALTGYSHGAAGYGLVLLKIHALERGLPTPHPLPDNPFRP
jgi:lantibiotic modifying enzyme